MDFEWDAQKAQANEEKHGVSFIEAVTAFADHLALLLEDPDHSSEEQRGILIGNTTRGRVVVVSYTIRKSGVRIISSREASPAERRMYANR